MQEVHPNDDDLMLSSYHVMCYNSFRSHILMLGHALCCSSEGRVLVVLE